MIIPAQRIPFNSIYSLEKGKLEGKIEEVKNLLIKMDMADTQAADIAGVSVDFVKKVRGKIKKYIEL